MTRHSTLLVREWTSLFYPNGRVLPALRPARSSRSYPCRRLNVRPRDPPSLHVSRHVRQRDGLLNIANHTGSSPDIHVTIGQTYTFDQSHTRPTGTTRWALLTSPTATMAPHVGRRRRAPRGEGPWRAAVQDRDGAGAPPVPTRATQAWTATSSRCASEPVVAEFRVQSSL